MADNKLGTIEHWLSLKEIDRHLGVSKETIRGWIKKGTIPNYKVGRQIQIQT